VKVDRVAMLALPQNGEFSEAVWWSEPYSEQVALDALHRADAIATLVHAAGASAAAVPPTADAFCSALTKRQRQAVYALRRAGAGFAQP
jgi:hypothetical protein